MIDLTRSWVRSRGSTRGCSRPASPLASTNVKFENGALTPYRQPKILDAASDVVGTGADSIYKAPEGWLWWTNDVDVVRARSRRTGSTIPAMARRRSGSPAPP